MKRETIYPPLYLPKKDFRILLELQGPSLGLWRAAEVAALREQSYQHPVLDLGCGDGLVTSMVLSEVEIGIDPNQQALLLAAKRGIYRQLRPIHAEAADIPDESIGTVISNSVFEHIPQINEVLRAAGRMLQHGGRLVFTAPTEIFSSWLTFPSPSYAARRNSHFDHINLWTVERWSRYLFRAGFEIEKVRPYLRHPLVTIWDMLELLQIVSIRRRRLFGNAWRRLPAILLDRLADRMAGIDLSASEPGGGRLIVARKR